MEVFIIYEESHGMIGIAKDYESAIDFLVQDHWLDLDYEIQDENYNWVTLRDLNISIEDIKQMGIDKFNDFFDVYFDLEIEKVWEKA